MMSGHNRKALAWKHTTNIYVGMVTVHKSFRVLFSLFSNLIKKPDQIRSDPCFTKSILKAFTTPTYMTQLEHLVDSRGWWRGDEE
jgi:hypothetical protein